MYYLAFMAIGLLEFSFTLASLMRPAKDTLFCFVCIRLFRRGDIDMDVMEIDNEGRS